MNDWTCLDAQMQRWASRLRDDLRITPPESNSLASTIAREVGQLPESVVKDLLRNSPIAVKDRLDELKAFQRWMDFARSIHNEPFITRAQVVVQNYVCFVYLGDAWFRKLRQCIPSGTVTKKCCCFLTDNPVRAFRNAVAHANWKYKPDFSGLEFWARKGSNPEEPMARFEVSQPDLSFWQALARCTAYVTYLAIPHNAEEL